MKQVWIVDDDQEMSNAMSMMLKLLDFQATCFINARNAVQSLQTSKRPDMMVLDINMPEFSGLDLLEFLRREPKWENMPIVMLSSEAADATVDKAMNLGADSYVMKPTTLEELEKAIDLAFKKHQKG
ncbi:MAG: PleD family two-component system response regulator [Anaerolineales bacterium]|jgi:DNA-binding response OmpR family regulator